METFDSFEEWFEQLTDRFTKFIRNGNEIDPYSVEGSLSDFWIEENRAGFWIEGSGNFSFSCQ